MRSRQGTDANIVQLNQCQTQEIWIRGNVFTCFLWEHLQLFCRLKTIPSLWIQTQFLAKKRKQNQKNHYVPVDAYNYYERWTNIVFRLEKEITHSLLCLQQLLLEVGCFGSISNTSKHCMKCHVNQEHSHNESRKLSSPVTVQRPLPIIIFCLHAWEEVLLVSAPGRQLFLISVSR